MNQLLAPWSVTARNLPEHAHNRIHTDAGAREAGFPRALVAGVTTYAYLLHPALAAWGVSWVESGAAEVRFRRPVFDGDLVRCGPVERHDDGSATVHALADETDQPRAIVIVLPTAPPAEALRAGEPLRPTTVRLAGEFGADYAERAGDDLTLCRDLGVVHPAVWPALANHVTHAQVVRGSWVHMRSIVRHHALAPVGEEAVITANVVRRFESHGERAVLDVHVTVAGVVVASLEHESIVALPGT
jgi:hypothetical protein